MMYAILFFMTGVWIGVIYMCIVQVNREEKSCLHCGKNAAAYCESCYQDLISKNAKLQLEIDTYKKARKEFEEEINKANMQVYSKFANHIPRID